MKDKFDLMTFELMKHKYAYYVQYRPIIGDYQYDMLEKEWANLGHKLGLLEEGATSPCVDFDFNHPLAEKVVEYFGVKS